MRATYAALFFISSVFALSASPFIVRAAQSFIYGGSFIGMKMIPGTSYGTYQTALKVDDAFTFRLRVHSPFAYSPTASVDLSAFGIAGPTTTPAGPGSPNYNSDSYYDFGPFIVSAGISDGLKAVPETITDADGGVATGTARIAVDSSPPTVTLSNITFSTTSPRQGDYMYLSGKVDGTGSAARVSSIHMSLTDGAGNPVVSPILGGSTFNFNTNDFNAILATSTDGSFSNVPIQLIEFGDIGWISRATNLRVDITDYDEAGNFATNGLTVLIPKTAPPDPCAAPGACASNALFLPGIEASRLYRPDYAGGTDKLWEPYGDADGADITLNPDGTATREDVYTKDVIGTAYVPLKGDIYKSFIDSMNTMKSGGIINDWEAAPYDWRLSLDDILNNGKRFSDGRLYYSGPLAATSTPYIIQELRRLAATSKTGKVTIVAHSNGGLVAKVLTDKLGSEASALIDKIVFVAVPQVGTPQAIGAILHGYDQALPISWFPAALSDSEARAIATNMPSAYNLLPSHNYFTQVDDPVITIAHDPLLAPWRARYGDTIHSGELLHAFLTDQSREVLPTDDTLKSPVIANESLLSKAENVHGTQLDNWTPPAGIELTEVAGWGEDTLKTIIYYQGTKSACTSYRADSTCTAVVRTPVLEYKVKTVLDGDGTVVVPSALWTPGAARYWVDLRKDNTAITLERKHADILEVPQLRALIQNIITGSTTASLPQYISTSTPPNDKPEKRLHFTLHSPLSLDMYDNLGNHTGISTTTGFLEENIPDSRYKTFGELKYISVPSSAHTRLFMHGYATGSFTLDMEEVLGDTTIASTTFAAIPSSASTVASLDIPTNGGIASSSPLAIDENGDGAIDITLVPKTGKKVIFDVTPPEAVIALDPLTQRLKVVGIDDLSSTTVSTTATSSTVTDEADNTLEIVFKKFEREKGELKLEIREFRYDGASAGVAARNALQYEWSADKAGKVRDLEQSARAGSSEVEAHYSAKKNVTKIEEKNGGKEHKKTLPGLVIIGLKTEKGNIVIDY